MHCNPIFFLHISPVHITVFQRQELGPWRSGVTNMGKKWTTMEIFIFISAEAQDWGRNLLLLNVSKQGWEESSNRKHIVRVH